MKVNKSFKSFREFINLDVASVIFDLGAWDGRFTKFFSRFTDQVISVEPDIFNLKQIYELLEKNKIKNVTVIQGAISDTDGFAELYTPYKDWQHSLYLKHKWNENMDKCLVRTFKWDTLVNFLGIRNVDFIKVNIEGSEEALIRGMNKVFPTKMIIEVHDKHKICDRDNLKKLLIERGYRIVKEVDYDDIYVERI